MTPTHIITIGVDLSYATKDAHESITNEVREAVRLALLPILTREFRITISDVPPEKPPEQSFVEFMHSATLRDLLVKMQYICDTADNKLMVGKARLPLGDFRVVANAYLVDLQKSINDITILKGP
jgi:hypothetical protein